MSRVNRKDILNLICEYVSARPEIKLCYLFGSIAMNLNNKLSDIDIAILIDKKILQGKYPYGYKAGILTDLLKVLKTNNVDLVILNDAPRLLRHRVIYSGKVIFSRDESERIKFQARTINEYNDLKKLLDIHQRV